MANDKKGFMAYADWIHSAEKMTDEEAGQIFKHLLRYVNDKDPEPPNRLIELSFEPWKQQLKRDLKKYERRVEVSRSNGKKGGRPKTRDKIFDIDGNKIPETSSFGHFVYVIYDKARDEFKVGETKNLIQRRLDIKEPTANLEIFCFGMDDAFKCQKIEREILKKHKHSSAGGDWLAIHEDEAYEIKKYISQETQQVNLIPKKADKDNVTVIDNVTVKDKDILEVRSTAFYQKLVPYLTDYSKDIIRDFFDYWTEHNEGGKKMRFELAKNNPFNIKRRLGTWKKKQNEFKPIKNTRGRTARTAERQDFE